MAMMACTSGSSIQLHIHHPLANSHNAGGGGYLAGKFTLYKRYLIPAWKWCTRYYLFMAMMAWYQRCHRRRARIPFIHAVSSVCNTSTYTWTHGNQGWQQHTTECAFVLYSMYRICTWTTGGQQVQYVQSKEMSEKALHSTLSLIKLR